MARRSSQAVDWVGLCREWRGSGLTQPEFCRRRDLSLHTFRRRLYHPGPRGAAGDQDRPAAAPHPNAGPPARTPSPHFLPVRVIDDDRPAPADLPPRGHPVEVILSCGRRVAVPPGFDADTLLLVVALLEQQGC
jgi:hypothetical protein